MPTVTIRPTDAALRRYQSTLAGLKQQQGVTHEGCISFSLRIEWRLITIST